MRAKEDGKEESFVKWFSELSNKDVAIAGGKGASLAEMYNIKMPVPPGFVITAQAYAYFIRKTKVDEDIKHILSNLDVENTEALNKASRKIREIIETAEMPKELEEEIVETYEILGARKEESADVSRILKKHDEPFVAVRSSATTEDLADASFAGQQDTYVNVRGKKQLLESVKKCMSSLFTARAIYYRTKKGFDHNKAYLAVVVQKMVNSEKSGVIFSQNPTSNDKTIVIEAVFGLGEGIVSGKIKPDHYVVSPDLDNFKILAIEVSNKKIAMIRDNDGKNKTINLNEEKADSRVLDSYEIKRLAQYSKELEKHYGKPQDIEFAIDKDGIFIVQSRPVTTTHKESARGEISGEVLLSGLGASPGAASGIVRIVHDLSELEKVKPGDVLVTEMTNPDMVVSMEKAAAIVTDEGGITSHAAIVSREMGIPCVVGTETATKRLKEGEVITVDGSSGKVYRGKGETKLIVIEPVVDTRTEIKVIIDIPHFAERAARTRAKAVGLTRLEGIIAASGKHPLKFEKNGRIKDYVKIIYDGVKEITSHFHEVWVRTSDIRSDEFVHLDGAPQIVEGNPMLGDHGIRFSLKHPEILKAELTAIKEVADDFPDKKIGIMMPQLISVEEVRETKKFAREIGMPKNVRMGIMVETPAAVQVIEELCKEGIDFISFGTNDLTQFTLAIDRNNPEVQHIYTEMHPAVLSSIKYVIHVCKRYGVQTSICGQAGSREDMARFLVENGIDSISVNADAARKVSELVARIEAEKSVEQREEKTIEDKVIVSHQEENKDKEKFEREMEMKNLKVPLMAQDNVENIDIEEKILKELEDENGGEYNPGDPDKEKKDIPPLHDAVDVDSEMPDNEKKE
ncbi:phosphoenolpyruvate synthase [Candidatus Pacearchaeota archaeon]|nr:phosphoenolpyruvate synthase [Candidatus Pacearchaeota archaeon]